MYMVTKYIINESRQVEICESCLESGPAQHGLGELGEPVGDGPGWCEGARHDADQADAADAHDRLPPAEYAAWLAEAASSTDAADASVKNGSTISI